MYDQYWKSEYQCIQKYIEWESNEHWYCTFLFVRTGIHTGLFFR